MTGGRILVTGAGGFVGTAVCRVLDRSPYPAVRVLAHQRPAGGATEVVRADLTDPGSLHGCCDGVDVVLHLASEVGADQRRCDAVNRAGTAHLLAEADRAGVRDVVYLSTAAVHGTGPHRFLPESAVPTPVSPASRSRLAAERFVRAAGGIVLRPFFIYGHGDRWFVPTLLRWLRRRPAMLVDGGSAPQSVVAVEDLAEVLVCATRHPSAFAGPPAHVCEPQPVRVGEALLTLARLYRLTPPRFNLPGAAARAVLRAVGARRLARQVELLGVEHTYQSDRAWTAAGVTAGPPMLERITGYADWYAGFARPPLRDRAR